MKRLFLLLIIISQNIIAQVTTVPGAPTANASVTLTLNTAGTGLEGYTGDIYGHTGVNVNGTRWENTIGTWGDNTVQPLLTKINDTTYQLEITPDLYTFYGVATTDVISEINIVFRSADGSQQTSPDIHIEIFEPELNITITSPNNNSVFDNNTSTNIIAESPIDANLELFVNNTSVQTATNTKNISFNYTFTTTGQHTIKATASDGTNTVEKEISVYVRTTTQNEAVPAGATNGVNINTDNSVTFVILAPQKNDIFLIGDFNNWSLDEAYQLKKDGDLFWVTINGLNPDTEYAYQYFIDYDKKVADPYAEKVLDESNDQFISDTNYPNLKAFPTDASGIVSTFLINDPEYSWASSNFTKPAKEKLVIYELLVRDFSTDDSFQSVIDRLDYLENLGINALELMPVNEFEGNDSWGYNVSHFFALDKAYGTKNKFKELVDKCHQRGIAVIVDVVFNHSFSQCPLLEMYDFTISNGTTSNNPFFNDTHNFDESGLQFGFDFNHEATVTQNYFKDVMSYWIEEYQIDGFRLDFTKGFTNTQYSVGDFGSAFNQTRIDRLTDYANYVWANHGNDVYMILEHLADNSEEKALADAGMMLWGKMTEPYNQNTMGFSGNTDISWGYYQNRNFNQPNLVTYMESHDEERLMYKNLQFGNASGGYDVKDLNTALKRQEAAAAMFLTIPGPKMIWQFGELGYDISIDQNGRTGRKPVLWNYFDVPERKDLYNIMATLAKFKQEHEVFSTNNVTLDVAGLVKRINLNHASNDVVLVANFDVVAQNVNPNFPNTGIWFEYFSDTEFDATSTTVPILLQPGEYKLYSRIALENPLSIESFSFNNKTILYPNPALDFILINKDIDKLTIYNTLGKEVFKISDKITKNQPININLTSGIYIVNITSEGKITTKKLLVN